MRNFEKILSETGYGSVILNMFKLVENGDIGYSNIKDYMESKISSFPFPIPSHIIEKAIVHSIILTDPEDSYFSKIRKILTTKPKYDFAFLFMQHYNVYWSAKQQELFENELYRNCYNIQDNEEDFSREICELFLRDEFVDEIGSFLEWISKEGEQLNNIIKELI